MAPRARLTVRSRGLVRTARIDEHRTVSFDESPERYETHRLSPTTYRIVRRGRGRRVWTVDAGATRWVFVDGRTFRVEVDRLGVRRERSAGIHETLSAQMPATVVEVRVEPGVTVASGDALIVLEAMKMELTIRAPDAGTVTAVHCTKGELVQPNVPLVELD